VDILHLFGEVSGLGTNLQKSNVLPIICGDQDLQLVQSIYLMQPLISLASTWLTSFFEETKKGTHSAHH
jgi:hypothetical protein